MVWSVSVCLSHSVLLSSGLRLYAAWTTAALVSTSDAPSTPTRRSWRTRSAAGRREARPEGCAAGRPERVARAPRSTAAPARAALTGAPTPTSGDLPRVKCWVQPGSAEFPRRRVPAMCWCRIPRAVAAPTACVPYAVHLESISLGPRPLEQQEWGLLFLSSASRTSKATVGWGPDSGSRNQAPGPSAVCRSDGEGQGSAKARWCLSRHPQR